MSDCKDRSLKTLGGTPDGDGPGQTPLVSVCMITYNHRDFLAQALDSVLMQEVDFPVEIILHDDCSTDGTADIVRSYADRYPQIIRAICQKENQYSQGKKPFLATFQLARGKYVALLEGDDVWADPRKLSRQVEFLEQNESYILCYGNATIIDGQGGVLMDRRIPDAECRHLTQKEMIECRHVIPMATVMLRNHPVLRNLPKRINKVLNGDTFLFALLGQYGSAGYLDFAPSLYRWHSGGIYSAKNTDQRLVSGLNSYRNLHACLKYTHRLWLADTMAYVYEVRAESLWRERENSALVRNLFAWLWFSARHRPVRGFFCDLRGSLRYARKVLMTGFAGENDRQHS